MALPVAYNGTECVKNPPAATTQRAWSRRTRSLALSGVSKVDPLTFLTGANSSSRNTCFKTNNFEEKIVSFFSWGKKERR